MSALNGKQLCIMIFFIPLVFKMASLPALLFREASQTAYLLIALLTTLEFLQLGLVLFVANRGGMESVLQRYGKGAFLALSLPMLFIVFLKMIVLAQEIASYATGFFFYNLPQTVILPILLVAVLYIGTRGARAIGRCYEVSVWLIVLIAVFGIFFGKAQADFTYLTPLFDRAPATYGRAVTKYLVYAFDFSPLLFFSVRVKRVAPVAICSCFSVLAVTACYALLYCVYGNASSYAGAAFARLAAFNTVISEIGSLDSPAVLLWLATALLSLALKIAAVDRIFSVARVKKAGTFLYLFAVWLVLTLSVKTLADAMKVVTSGVQYGVFFAEILLPLAILLLLSVKKRTRAPIPEGV